MSRRHHDEEFNEDIAREILRTEQEELHVLRKIEHDLHPPTPIHITFQEITMLSATAGNTLVFTGTLAPSGSAFPAGTTFAVTSSDSTVSPTVDATGLIVTIPLPTGFVDNPTSPLTVTYTASGITPEPSTSPTSITAAITPTVPVPPTPTPTAISFAQTT
jgi:hypothetical protein